MALVAFLETITLGVIAFFASAVTDPDAVLSSRYLLYVKQIVTIEFLSSSKGLIIASGFVMVFMIALKNSIKAIISYWITRFGVGLEAYFGEILFDGFLKLPYEWHLNKNSADLVNAIRWRTFLGSGFFQPCLNILNSLLMVFIMLTALFMVQPLVSFIVFLVLGGSATFIFTIIRHQIDKVASVARDYQITINKEITMAIQGIKDVKISLNEKSFVDKFLKKAQPLSRISGVQGFYVQVPVLILETIGFGMLFVSIYVMLVLTETSTAFVTGTMALLAVTAWKAIPASNLILGNMARIRKSLPYIASQMEYFKRIESDQYVKVKADVPACRFRKSLKLKNVCYSYGENGINVINDLCFEIKKGETIGIIGKSGAGKSTLVDLLIGLLEPYKGKIQIDDQTLTRAFLPQWLKITGYVAQSPYICDGTLAENIAFGISTSAVNRTRVFECCTMASMDDFIHDLPKGIDSFIGERGVKLSGGQQQRVAIARALYNKPEVIIFDEATSSLDTKSEKSIQETIYSLKGTHTLIIIAHRLSTVMDCDKLIWLEKGQVRLFGKPEVVLDEYKKEVGVVAIKD